MITLYAFEPGFGMPSGSPFVVKTMIHLTMAKQPFEVEITADFEDAPKGKLPYIGDDGGLVADSELIRAHLERSCGVDFDPGLTPRDKADGIAYTRLAEEHLYWCGMYHQWQIDAHWAVTKPLFFKGVPSDQIDAIADKVREQVIRDLHSQGLGRHSPTELLAFAERNFHALADRLGNGRFWFGDTVTSTDAAIAPQIQMIAGDPLNGPLNDALKAHPNLVAYASRVLETALPKQMARLAA